jgi:hypothetical protein
MLEGKASQPMEDVEEVDSHIFFQWPQYSALTQAKMEIK